MASALPVEMCNYCTIEISENILAISLTKCAHILCGSCFENLIAFADQSKVKCPIVTCSREMIEQDIKSGVSTKIYDAYKKRIADAVKSLQITEREFSIEEIDDDNSGWAQIRLSIEKLMENGMSFEEANNMIDFQTVLPTVLKTDCTICLEEIEVGNGIVIKNCLHIFCRTCLAEVVKHSDDSEVTCPFTDGKYKCEEKLKPLEVLGLTDPKTYYKHYNDLAIKAVEGSFIHCMTPNCNYFCELAENSVGFQCPRCQEFNCYSCKVQHTNQSCTMYKEYLQAEERRKDALKADEANRLLQQQNSQRSEQEIQRQLQSRIFRTCPNCRVVIEKNGGCDHMSCWNCKVAYNWSSGSRR